MKVKREHKFKLLAQLLSARSCSSHSLGGISGSSQVLENSKGDSFSLIRGPLSPLWGAAMFSGKMEV